MPPETLKPYYRWDPDSKLTYDGRALEVAKPWELERIFQERPLDEKFLDWVVEIGFTLRYDTELPSGSGNVDFWGYREIVISPHGTESEKDLTLIHELVHIAIFPASFRQFDEERKELEAVIDRISKDYLKNRPEFIAYAKKVLPVRRK